MSIIIAVTGDKGGVGKSTVACLLAEWFGFSNKKVKLIDADPNRTTQLWIEKCLNKGYKVFSDDAEITIVDTAGTSGASLIRYVQNANLIIAPFQPHIADLETIINWFLSLNSSLQKKICFMPNRLENTKEQREGIRQLEQIIKEENVGCLIPGLANRPAIYPILLNGSDKNFFQTLTNEKVIAETRDVVNTIKKLILEEA